MTRSTFGLRPAVKAYEAWCHPGKTPLNLSMSYQEALQSLPLSDALVFEALRALHHDISNMVVAAKVCVREEAAAKKEKARVGGCTNLYLEDLVDNYAKAYVQYVQQHAVCVAGVRTTHVVTSHEARLGWLLVCCVTDGSICVWNTALLVLPCDGTHLFVGVLVRTAMRFQGCWRPRCTFTTRPAWPRCLLPNATPRGLGHPTMTATTTRPTATSEYWQSSFCETLTSASWAASSTLQRRRCTRSFGRGRCDEDEDNDDDDGDDDDDNNDDHDDDYDAPTARCACCLVNFTGIVTMSHTPRYLSATADPTAGGGTKPAAPASTFESFHSFKRALQMTMAVPSKRQQTNNERAAAHITTATTTLLP